MAVEISKLIEWASRFPPSTLVEILDLESLEANGEVFPVHCYPREDPLEGDDIGDNTQWTKEEMGLGA